MATIDITSKVKQVLKTSEAKDIIIECIMPHINKEIASKLTSYDSRGSNPTTREIKDIILSHDVKKLLVSDFNATIDQKIQNFAGSGNFKSIVKDLVSCETFYDLIIKNMLLDQKIKEKIDNVCPSKVKAEIRQQLDSIIEKYVSNILKNQLKKKVVNQVDAYLKTCLTDLVAKTADEILLGKIEYYVSSQLPIQIRSYFDNAQVQEIFSYYINNLLDQLRQTASIEINNILQETMCRSFSQEYITITKNFCDEQLAHFRTTSDNEILVLREKVNQQILNNERSFEDLNNDFASKLDSQFKEAEKTFLNQLLTINNTLTDNEKSLNKLHDFWFSQKQKIEYLEKFKLYSIIGFVGVSAALLFTYFKTPKITLI